MKNSKLILSSYRNECHSVQKHKYSLQNKIVAETIRYLIIYVYEKYNPSIMLYLLPEVQPSPSTDDIPPVIGRSLVMLLSIDAEIYFLKS